MLSFHVKFVQTDRQMDRQTDNSKTVCPSIFQYGSIKNIKSVFHRVEDIKGKGEKCWFTSIFLLFP